MGGGETAEMARRVLACASTFVLATALATPAFADGTEAPRVGAVVVPGLGGAVLGRMVAIFHRPPAPQVARMPSWLLPPPGLPRATIATVWKVTF